MRIGTIRGLSSITPGRIIPMFLSANASMYKQRRVSLILPRAESRSSGETESVKCCTLIPRGIDPTIFTGDGTLILISTSCWIVVVCTAPTNFWIKRLKASSSQMLLGHSRLWHHLHSHSVHDGETTAVLHEESITRHWHEYTAPFKTPTMIYQ